MDKTKKSKIPWVLIIIINILNWFTENLPIIYQVLPIIYIGGAIIFYIISVSNYIISLILNILTCSVLFYFYKIFLGDICSYYFQLVLQQKLLVIMAFLVSTFSLQEYNLLLNYFGMLRIFIFISMLIFIYDEYRRHYFDLYSKRLYEWRYEYIFWFITYISIIIIYNPFFPITMSSRDTWRFLDIMSALLIIFSLMRDIIIGVDLVFKYFQYKESIERYGEEISRRKLFICKEYGCGLGTGYRYLPSIECSLEHKEDLNSWTNDEKLIFNVDDSDLWDSSLGIKRLTV